MSPFRNLIFQIPGLSLQFSTNYCLVADITAPVKKRHKAITGNVYGVQRRSGYISETKNQHFESIGVCNGARPGPHYLLNLCEVGSYEDDACALIRRMMKDQLELFDFVRDGDSLSYKARYADGTRASVYVANRDRDGVKLEIQSASKGTYIGEWTRSKDGTETFSSFSPDETYSYTENPDCSGRAKACRKDDAGHDWILSWSWNSVNTNAPVIVQYSECKTIGLDEEECIRGTL